MTQPTKMLPILFTEIMRDAHHYVPGIQHRQPTVLPNSVTGWRRLVARTRERSRDAVERAADRAGFSHRHFEPETAAQRILRVTELMAGLEETYELLGNEPSRRALIDVLKLRVLGPEHAQLAITPQAFRSHQAQVDSSWRINAATFEVSDPWFSPLSLYRIPLPDGASITMHGHSVDLVSVFLLGQYGYTHATEPITVRPGDVVLDIGGCWGDTALYFAHLVGPEGKVYTFEFDPESLVVLRANLALNPELAERIEVIEKAVWEQSGQTLEFTPAGRCTTLTRVASPSSGRVVETVTLDDFVEQMSLDRIDFVKMDVEGAESSVLRGASGVLDRLAPAIAVAAYHHDDDLVTIPHTIIGSRRDWRFYLSSSSPVEEETVLFASATRVKSSTY